MAASWGRAASSGSPIFRTAAAMLEAGLFSAGPAAVHHVGGELLQSNHRANSRLYSADVPQL
jgi:hypothetical protein